MPAPTHTFVGREPELEQINDLLLSGSVRLITLAGQGGIGKTQLAAEAVSRFGAEIDAARVCWVRLARLPKNSDVAAVARETAAAVTGTDVAQRAAWDALVDGLSETDAAGGLRRTVLVLDNCEHVLGSVRQLIAQLLEAVPQLTIVSASRGPIGWIDERLIVVPPLTADQALALFQQRAELTGRPLADDEEDALAAEICRHIDHHPLFIQLAAARLRRQPLSAIRDELTGNADDDRRLHWSLAPRAGVDPRHHAVPDVIEWSYNLCSPKERLLFERMPVFAAGHDTNPEERADRAAEVGADLDAIEAVCADDDRPADDADGAPTLPRAEIEDLLERLADHSLVTVHLTTTSVRYSLVESVRMFAWARLGARTDGGAELARLTARHLRYYRDRIARALSVSVSAAEPEVLDWARAAWDNIVIAINTSVAVPGQAAAGLQICLGLIALRIPFLRGSTRDIGRHTERCLAATGALRPQPAELQLAARAALSWLAVRRGQSDEAQAMLEQCVADCLAAGAHPHWHDRPEVDMGLPAQLELTWGTALFMDDRDPRAIAVLVRARDKFHEFGDECGELMAGMFAGCAAALLGSSEQAHDIARRCLERARGSGAAWATSWAELGWAITLTKHGDPAEAAEILRGALEVQLSVQDRWGAAWSVELRTWALGHLIAAEDAATDSTPADRGAVVGLATEIAYLAGGVDTLRAELGIDIAAMGTFADESRRALDTARRVLGPDAFAAAEARGRELRPDTDEVHRLALGTVRLEAAPDGVPTLPWHGVLTPAERRVAVLVAAGYRSHEIAALRDRSRRTVETQIAAIYKKLNVTRRADIIGHVPESVLPEVEAAQRKHAAATAGRPRR